MTDHSSVCILCISMCSLTLISVYLHYKKSLNGVKSQQISFNVPYHLSFIKADYGINLAAAAVTK